MTAGQQVRVSGYITQDKFLIGRPLSQLERHLGFHPGRLANGATFVRLDRLPLISEFELAGYSMTAEHRHATPSGLDILKLKELARSSWRLTGGDRLIKVFATTRHDPSMNNDVQYPPGDGVPQWKVVGSGIPGTIVAEVSAQQIYRPLT